MMLHGVECEQTADITVETYVCRWDDRHKLALGFLSQGKGTRISDQPGNERTKGIMRRRFALVMVESYS